MLPCCLRLAGCQVDSYWETESGTFCVPSPLFPGPTFPLVYLSFSRLAYCFPCFLLWSNERVGTWKLRPKLHLSALSWVEHSAYIVLSPETSMSVLLFTSCFQEVETFCWYKPVTSYWLPDSDVPYSALELKMRLVCKGKVLHAYLGVWNWKGWTFVDDRNALTNRNQIMYHQPCANLYSLWALFWE